MKKLSKIAAIILATSTLITGCSASTNKHDKHSKEKNPDKKAITSTVETCVEGGIDFENALDSDYDEDALYEAYINYCFNLANECSSEATSNMMVSPASVMLAVNMTAAGANNETLNQITNVFAPDSDVDNNQMQAFASNFYNELTQTSGIELHVANSIWAKESVLSQVINNSFLTFAEDAYGAEVNMAAFDDSTIDDINGWIDENTNGMIPEMINEINPDTILMLINAIAFEGQWAEEYTDSQVRDGVFTGSNGEQTVPFLHSTEYTYYETDDAVGFRKYYQDGGYYFLAILPNENIDANEYLANMSGEDYREFIESSTNAYDVVTTIPEFTFDYDITLNDAMQNLGMTNAFDSNIADFSNIAQIDGGNLYISKILHKTHIELDRSGTRAAAATVVVMDCETCAEPTEVKYVELNRPFVFAIVDSSTDAPLFIGTVNEI